MYLGDLVRLMVLGFLFGVVIPFAVLAGFAVYGIERERQMAGRWKDEPGDPEGPAN